jgi:predicted PurR-regulated permease PerM
MVAAEVNRSRAGWLVLGGALALAVSFVVYSFVGTFVFGLFVYYSTRPVYDRVNRRIDNRSMAAVLSLLALALPVLLLFAYTVAVGLGEANSAIQQYQNADLGGLGTYLEPYLDVSSGVQNPVEVVTTDPTALLDQPGIQNALTTALDQGLGVLAFLGNAALRLFIVIALAYYLLKDGRRLSRWSQAKFADDRGVLDEYVAAVDRDLQNVFFGNILNALLTGIIGAVSYSALNAFLGGPVGTTIPYPVLVGLLAGVGSLVPVLGMKIVYVPVAAYLGVQAFTSGASGAFWFPVVFVVVSFFVVDVVPDLGLRPYVSGRNLHVGTVMFAYIFGPLLFGWYGLFLGPLLLVLAVHFARIVVPELVAERTFAPYSVDPSYLTVDRPPADAATPVTDEAVSADGAGDEDAPSAPGDPEGAGDDPDSAG